MILYNDSGVEINYGRTKRVYLYDKFEDPAPSWLTIDGAVSVEMDNLSVVKNPGNVWVRTKPFYIKGCDAIRFSLNNFSKNETNSLVSLRVYDNSRIVEFLTKNPAGQGVALYDNDLLIKDIDKFNFNGELVKRSRKLGIHYCPQTGYIALLENDRVGGHHYIEKFDLNDTISFALRCGSNFITSQVEILSWTSM